MWPEWSTPTAANECFQLTLSLGKGGERGHDNIFSFTRLQVTRPKMTDLSSGRIFGVQTLRLYSESVCDNP